MTTSDIFNTSAFPSTDPFAGGLLQDDNADEQTGWGSMLEYAEALASAQENLANVMQAAWGDDPWPDVQEEPKAETSAPASAGPPPAELPPEFVFSVALERNIQTLPRLRLRALK